MPAGWGCMRMRRVLARLPCPWRSWRWLVGCVLLFNLGCVWLLLSHSPGPWRRGHFLPLPLRTAWTCRPVRLSPRPLPRTALVSFPGSGNTWVRHLLQQATGVATGSVYNDSWLASWGFPGEGLADERVLLVKTHEYGDAARARFARAVLVLRNPFHALRAEFNRQYGGHLGHAPREVYDIRWRRFVSASSRYWFEVYSDWLRFKGPLHVLAFADLVKDTEAEVRRLLTFLGVVVAESDVGCMMTNTEGPFKRLRAEVTVLHHSPFSASMRESLAVLAANLSLQLHQRLGPQAARLAQAIQAPVDFP